LAGFSGATTSIAAGLRTTLPIDARLTNLAADAITILNSEDATNALVLVYTSEVFLATHLSARLSLRTTFLIVDADLVLLATDTIARHVRRLAANTPFAYLTLFAADALADNIIGRAARDTIFTDLALIAADVVATVMSLRTAEASGMDACIRLLAAMFSGARDQTLRATNSLFQT